MSAPAGERYSRRQMWAALALLGLPAPAAIDLYIWDEGTSKEHRMVCVDLASGSDLAEWLAHFDPVPTQVEPRPVSMSVRDGVVHVYMRAELHGWPLQVHAEGVLAAEPELGDATRAGLAAVAAGGDLR